MAYVAGRSFPGNVRQLENICHWLTVMAPTQVIEVGDLPAELRDEAPAAESDWHTALAREVERMLARGELSIMENLATRFKKTLISRALAYTRGAAHRSGKPAWHRPQHHYQKDRRARAGGEGNAVGMTPGEHARA